MKTVIEAHVIGVAPNIIINISEISPYDGVYLVYFFGKATMSVYLLGVDSFNQPEVELYKENMFRLLEKTVYNKVSKNI